MVALLALTAFIFAYLIYHIKATDKTLPENVKELNRLMTEKTFACDMSNDRARCERAKLKLEEFKKKAKQKY